jgi:hypothetical protein
MGKRASDALAASGNEGHTIIKPKAFEDRFCIQYNIH